MLSWQNDGAEIEKLNGLQERAENRRAEFRVTTGTRQLRRSPCSAWRRLHAHRTQRHVMQLGYPFRVILPQIQHSYCRDIPEVKII